MSENLTIFKKGLVLIAVPLLFQLIFIGFLVRILRDSIEVERLSARTRDVIIRTESAFRTLVHAQSAARGLVITGDPIFSRSYEKFIQRLPAQLESLRLQVRGDPEWEASVTQIADRIEQLRAWAEEINRLVLTGRREEAVRRVASLKGMHLMDGVREEVETFLAMTERADRTRRAALQRSWRLQIGFLAGGAILTVLVALGMAVAFGRGISRRLGLLTQNAQRLAEGKELAAPLSGRDEIAQLDRVFHEMASTLAHRNQEIEMFIYSVSHDLRSPLVNLQGFSEELKFSCAELSEILERSDLPPAAREQARAVLEQEMPQSLQFIQTAVARLASIIDALLRLSRAGRVEYRWQPVDVDATVRRIVTSLQGTLTERGAQVRLGALPPAWGDPTVIEQIFSNLITNAVNYLDPSRPGLIEIGGSVDEAAAQPSVTYHVKDNGLGIDKSYQSRLFLAFQRFHPRVAEGEGIGLALVRRAVERHGGRVWVDSQPGVGSTFFVSLPARQPGEPPDG